MLFLLIVISQIRQASQEPVVAATFNDAFQRHYNIYPYLRNNFVRNFYEIRIIVKY